MSEVHQELDESSPIHIHYTFSPAGSVGSSETKQEALVGAQGRKEASYLHDIGIAIDRPIMEQDAGSLIRPFVE